MLAINIDLALILTIYINGIAIAEPPPTNMLIALGMFNTFAGGKYDGFEKNLQRVLAVFASGACRMPRDGSAGQRVIRPV